MGSKGRMPPPHLRRPPSGPGMVHPDPFGAGIHPPAGSFPPFEMLTPPEIMEQKLAAQHVDMQKLVKENQRLAATHGTLRQELAAAQHELQILHSEIGAVKSEKEHQARGLMDQIAKMEAELQVAEPIKLELQQARAEAQSLVSARQELILKGQQLNQDLQRAHSDVQQVSILLSERESLRQEYHHWRGTYEYEKKLYNDHLESLQLMEKNYLTMAREVEKLRAELTNTAGIDRRPGGAYGGSAMHNENEASGIHPVGQNTFEDGYNVPQAQGGLPGGGSAVAVTAGSAHGGTQSGSNSVRTSYDATKGPNYDGQRGTGVDAQRGSGYDGHRGASYDGQRGPGYDVQGIPGYDLQRGPFGDTQTGNNYKAQRGPGYDGQRATGYEPQRGLTYEANKASGYDAPSRGATNTQGQAAPPNRAGTGYGAQVQGGNPGWR